MQETNLNIEQQKAVNHNKTPLLIIAGAGTGKTTVISERIKRLIIEKKAQPQEILAVTFTEKAAKEMEERVDQALPYGYTQTWIMTFHSFCDRLLRNEAINIGLNPGYKLIAEAEAIGLIQNHLWDMSLKYFRPRGNPTKFISGILSHISRLKDEDITTAQYSKWVNNNSKSEDNSKWKELASAYSFYEELKIQNGVMDFSDLISNTLELLRTRPDILKQYQQTFKHILVDEFQDTNIAQYELIKLLTAKGTKPLLTVVGDDSQSVYKFRGAAISNILSFMKDYPNSKQIVLTKNYRSTQTILDHAYNLIKHNDPDTLEASLGIDKNLTTTRKEATQKPIQLFFTDREEQEADSVISTITKLRKEQKYSWSDFAILLRANSHGEPFIKSLKRNGIPYQFLGPNQLFRTEEIRDLIAYIKTLAHFDDSASFYRVLAMPIWNIPGRDLAALNTWAKRTNHSLFELCEEVTKQYQSIDYDRTLTSQQLPNLSTKTKDQLAIIISMIHRHLNFVPRETGGQILYYFLADSGQLAKLAKNPESLQDELQLTNISKFFDKLKSYEASHEDASVDAINNWIELSLEVGESPSASDLDWIIEDRVNILTVHSAKGLEFKVVFLVNLVNLRFPTTSRREQIPIPDELIREKLPSGDFHVQEERRLFYVGMTRAKDQLFFTASKSYADNKREKKLSGFVQEALGESYRTTNPAIDQLDFFESWKATPESVEPAKLHHQVSYLSYSQISAFRLCPLHYKLRYILKVPTLISPALIFGTNIHTTLRDYYTYLINNNPHSKDKLLQFLESNWQTIGFKNKKEEQVNLSSAKEYLSGFYDQAHSQPIYTKALEEKFTLPLTPTIKIGGIIDRIDVLPSGEIEIIDYKTSNKVPTQRQVDKDEQLTIYALAATQVHHPLFLQKPQNIKLSLYYFANQQKLTTIRSTEELKTSKENIIKLVDEMENSNYACSKHFFCKHCEYKLYCNPA
ncbi:hypothetical protein COW99_01170 [Candidatus Roizmanbacteria bacterium CG22_combo_CG10-13_8_21_14_all_38_20]|uniref:DNA 3'-5' helicase n=1 Tax=Candidatus Roizmanbacteria bacterium CG22_combo_CG10-13_8_21_14_all_38_20 TaxID=1974862 RepID=A0A2H0BWE0_9BACT|nr:UvrD-helicase domain-containing protein [Candidatus Microgenomates bacterium]PIP61993.1 MAG: hypothetical protein COW99_01170 [Candidatus Roizmanbacteria bacterium CG22_combo_CG10-13_8_21_14_all_38_20]PJC31348.1 MAG: hypothetical protein CO050_03725 [Candidatus Roizmanbacteria bacterium CG_4_9_14_0_2_um_filter_38_17]